MGGWALWRQKTTTNKGRWQSFHFSLCNGGSVAVHNSKEVRDLPSCLLTLACRGPVPLTRCMLCTQYEVVPYSQRSLLKVPDLRRIIVFFTVSLHPPGHLSFLSLIYIQERDGTYKQHLCVIVGSPAYVGLLRYGSDVGHAMRTIDKWLNNHLQCITSSNLGKELKLFIKKIYIFRLLCSTLVSSLGST